jgi:hypothetical protein
MSEDFTCLKAPPTVMYEQCFAWCGASNYFPGMQDHVCHECRVKHRDRADRPNEDPDDPEPEDGNLEPGVAMLG